MQKLWILQDLAHFLFNFRMNSVDPRGNFWLDRSLAGTFWLVRCRVRLVSDVVTHPRPDPTRVAMSRPKLLSHPVTPRIRRRLLRPKRATWSPRMRAIWSSRELPSVSLTPPSDQRTLASPPYKYKACEPCRGILENCHFWPLFPYFDYFDIPRSPGVNFNTRNTPRSAVKPEKFIFSVLKLYLFRVRFLANSPGFQQIKPYLEPICCSNYYFNPRLF